jgi:hypothetical protein
MTADSVQKNVVVSMEYTLHVDNEEVDSSKGQDPLQFLVGHGNIISGFEREMMGMKVGESKDVVIEPADAYGEFDEDAFMEVPRDAFPQDIPVEEGSELTVRDDAGQARYVAAGASCQHHRGRKAALQFLDGEWCALLGLSLPAAHGHSIARIASEAELIVLEGNAEHCGEQPELLFQGAALVGLLDELVP